MSENICEHCSAKFMNKYTLKNHQKTAKFCLEIQNKNLLLFTCEFCSKNFNRKDTLDIHTKSCKIFEKIKTDNIYKQLEELKIITETQKNTIASLNSNIKELESTKKIYDDIQSEYIKQKNEINSLHLTIKELEVYKNFCYKYELENDKQKEVIEKLASRAIDNAGTKNTTINNRNQIYNALQPLTNEHMKEQTKNLTYQNVKNGAHGIAHYASNFPFKDRIACTDKSRLNFVFKNEAGNIVKDPEGIEITNRFIDINREEIVRLVDEYLKCIKTELFDDATSGEMYKFWAEKREEFIAIRSAVENGNVSNNKESYEEFKKNFLTALSNLVPR